MKMIDVLNKQYNREIRKEMKLIIDFENLDILASYRNFEWSEYHESVDS